MVIGRRMKDVSVESALEYVFGYTVANESLHVMSSSVTVSGPGGRASIRSARSGPVVVTPDEFGSPGDLRLWTEVNGETIHRTTDGEHDLRGP